MRQALFGNDRAFPSLGNQDIGWGEGVPESKRHPVYTRFSRENAYCPGHRNRESLCFSQFRDPTWAALVSCDHLLVSRSEFRTSGFAEDHFSGLDNKFG